jgi:hypothetical protein
VDVSGEAALGSGEGEEDAGAGEFDGGRDVLAGGSADAEGDPEAHDVMVTSTRGRLRSSSRYQWLSTTWESFSKATPWRASDKTFA